jgi:hypothetical protein
MGGLTRRRVLKSGAAFAGGGMLTALSPDLVRGVTDLLISGQQSPNLSGTRTVANFAAGSGPQELGIQNLAGMEAQGPNAIAARTDGSLAILDTVNRRIAIVRGNRIQRTISLPAGGYPSDLQEAGGQLYVLDAGDNQVIEVSDNSRRSWALAAQSRGRTSGLSDAGAGALGVTEDDTASYRLAEGHASRAPGYLTAAGDRVHIEYEYPTINRHRANAYVGSTRVPVETQSFLGSVSVAGVDAAGRTYLLSSELIRGQTGIEVDLVLRRVERGGSVSALARVPVRNRWFNPTRAVTVTPSGHAFAIFPERGGTLLLELEWQPRLAALAAPLVLPTSKFEALAYNNINVCRQDAKNTADTYYAHAWYCYQANYDLCTQNIGGTNYTSQRPNYITGLGWYGYVPYAWNGWRTVAEFDSDMAASKSAGHTRTTPIGGMSCASGVDCSGFIQRCWGISDTKYNDTGLTAWCSNIADFDVQNPPPWMHLGDMYRWPGVHVRMHDNYNGPFTGVYCYESIGDPGRVNWTFYPWSAFNGAQWCIGAFGC